LDLKSNLGSGLHFRVWAWFKPKISARLTLASSVEQVLIKQ